MPTDHPKCAAKNRTGGRCSLGAGWGTNHVGVGRCRYHGGSSPQAELSGQIVLARRDYQVAGVPIDIDPHQAILQCIALAAGEVRYWDMQLADLTDAEAFGPVVTTRPLKEEKGSESAYERVEEHGAPAPHILIVLRAQAMDRLVNYSKIAIAAGIAERAVRIAEGQAQLLADAVRGILTELGVIDRPDAPAVVRKHLELVAGLAAA